VLLKHKVYLKPAEFNMDIKPLIRVVLSRMLGDISVLADAVSKMPSAIEGTATKAALTCPGDGQITCDPKRTVVVNIVKFFNEEQDRSFIALGRVLQGTLRQGDEVKVLLEGYTNKDCEDFYVATAEKLFLMQNGGRFKIQVDKVSAGMLIGIQGVDKGIVKTATLVSVKDEETVCCSKLDFGTEATIKMALEPLNPSELPKMLEGLRKVNKIYPLVKTRVEESGEHLIVGTGELYLDQVLKDMRSLYSEIEIKVSEPFVQINETVGEASAVRCFTETSNHKNQISMTTEPMEKGLYERIVNTTHLKKNDSVLSEMLVNDFGWDELTASSVWAFGPQTQSANMLIDYTIGDEIDQNLLNSCRNSIVQGF
jgi:U5 small nuclear ribonucleoprotein component